MLQFLTPITLAMLVVYCPAVIFMIISTGKLVEGYLVRPRSGTPEERDIAVRRVHLVSVLAIIACLALMFISFTICAVSLIHSGFFG